MTNQEAFNIVCEHLISQGKRSVLRSGRCRYRGPDGLMCAIGVLISEEHYSPSFEEESIKYIQGKIPTLVNVSNELLTDLQIVHDSRSPENWKYYLRDLAVEYNLTMPKCIKP